MTLTLEQKKWLVGGLAVVVGIMILASWRTHDNTSALGTMKQKEVTDNNSGNSADASNIMLTNPEEPAPGPQQSIMAPKGAAQPGVLYFTGPEASRDLIF